MKDIQIPPYLPLVAAEAVKKIQERMEAVKAANAGKLLLDKPVQRKVAPRG